MLKRTTQLKADPAKTRAWKARSKPLGRKSAIKGSLRSRTAGTPNASNGRVLARTAATGQRKRGISSKPRKPLKAKPDPKLAAWGRDVRKRDGNQCRWPGRFRGCVDFYVTASVFASPCATGDARIDPHHIAPRGRRPDLIYDVRNGICLCRTHHDWCHDNPRDAERMGLLNFDSYELAQKLKAGYVVLGDEDDHRVTL